MGGLKEGRGVYKDSSGAIYYGEFKGGLKEVYKYPSGAVYDEEFKGRKLEDREVYWLANSSPIHLKAREGRNTDLGYYIDSG